MRDKLFGVLGKIWQGVDIPFTGSLRFDLLINIYKLFPMIGIGYSRGVEYDYIFRNLPPPCKILDAGTTTSLFPFKLNSLGYETHCLDIRKPNFRLPKEIKFHQDNLLDIKLKEKFDVITCISVIEHIGIGRYGDPIGEDGDIKAVKGLLKLLKPNGVLILTTNTAKTTGIVEDSTGHCEMRYAKDRLDKIKSLGTVLNEEYRYFDGKYWIKCPDLKVLDLKYRIKNPVLGIAMWSMR